MSTFTIDDIRLSGGFGRDDLPLIADTMAGAITRLDSLNVGRLDSELSVKDRDGADPQVTLEVWPPGLPRLVATSNQADLRDALNEVSARITSQVGTLLERRDPRSGRSMRRTIRGQG